MAHASLAVAAGSASTARFGGRPARAAKRSRIQAPRCPGDLLGASSSSMPPPCSSRMRADDGEAEAGALLARRHIGLEQAAAVLLRQADAVVDTSMTMSSPSRAAETWMRPLAELGRRHRGDRLGRVLDDVGERLRDQPAVEARRHRVLGDLDVDVDVGIADPHAGTRPAAPCRRRPRRAITGFGMRAKRENSSTMRLMSSTWRTMVSVHCSKTSRSSMITLPYLRRSRSAESWIGVSGFLISCAMRRAMSAQAEVRCADDQVGDVVERDDVAVLGIAATARW